jgi:hypothetical protein
MPAGPGWTRAALHRRRRWRTGDAATLRCLTGSARGSRSPETPSTSVAHPGIEGDARRTARAGSARDPAPRSTTGAAASARTDPRAIGYRPAPRAGPERRAAAGAEAVHSRTRHPERSRRMARAWSSTYTATSLRDAFRLGAAATGRSQPPPGCSPGDWIPEGRPDCPNGEFFDQLLVIRLTKIG